MQNLKQNLSEGEKERLDICSGAQLPELSNKHRSSESKYSTPNLSIQNDTFLTIFFGVEKEFLIGESKLISGRDWVPGDLTGPIRSLLLLNGISVI